MRDNPRAVRRRVGRNIRRLRLLRGMSQERLAEVAGRNTKHIGQVERGRVDVGLDVLTSIAASLSVPLPELFGSAGKSHVVALAPRDFEQVERVWRALMRAKHATRPRARAAPARSRSAPARS